MWHVRIINVNMALCCIEVCKAATHAGRCNAGTTVTFPATDLYRQLAGTKLYCLMRGTKGCEQLAQSRFAAVPEPETEPTTY